MKYYVVESQNPDWTLAIHKYTDIICVQNIDQVPDLDAKIIPLTINNMIDLKHDHRILFSMDIDNMYILEHKCRFYQFMMNKFPDNIPKVHYIRTNGILYIDMPSSLTFTSTFIKLIKKKNTGLGGKYVTIIDPRDVDLKENDVVVTQYIEHTNFYVGHFFVRHGVILKSVYFKGYTNNNTYFVLRSPITSGRIKHEIVTDLDCDDTTIFSKLFENLNYTGFACADFIIDPVSNKIVLFEINPRVGGSLFHYPTICKEFMDLTKI